jgi:hypothetical protein
MKHPLRTSAALAALAALTLGGVASATVAIYASDMSTAGHRKELVKVGSGHCGRSGKAKVLKARVGKQTQQCSYRTPVVGRNLQIVATERLLSGTPDSIEGRVFVGVGLRIGSKGGYEFVAFPAKGTFQLRKKAPSSGEVTVIAHGESGAVKGINKANKLRLQAFAGGGGDLRLVGLIGGRKLAAVTETSNEAAKIPGSFSTILVGSNSSAKGASASFDDLQVSVPDPF